MSDSHNNCPSGSEKSEPLWLGKLLVTKSAMVQYNPIRGTASILSVVASLVLFKLVSS